MEWQVVAWIFIFLALILTVCLFIKINQLERTPVTFNICKDVYDMLEIKSVKTITPEMIYYFPGYPQIKNVVEKELTEEVLNEVKKYIEMSRHESPSGIIIVEGSLKVGIRRK